MGLFYFFLFFNMKGKLCPKVFWATPTPILPSPHPFPCCCFSESWNSSPHISISPLKPSFLVWVYPRLKQLSPKLPPRPLTRAAGWFWNWKWGILVPIEYRSETPKLGLTSMCCWSRSLVGYGPWDCRVGHDWSNWARMHAASAHLSALLSLVLRQSVSGSFSQAGVPPSGEYGQLQFYTVVLSFPGDSSVKQKNADRDCI